MLKANIQILREIRRFIEENSKTPENYVTRKGAFSRTGKLSFLKVVLLIIWLPKRNLSIELESFFDENFNEEDVCTKSGFSQARYKVDWHFFKDLCNVLLEWFYNKRSDKVKTWYGFRLNGIDGSTIRLPYHEQTIEEFGIQTNKIGGVPMARLLTKYDILNDIVTDIKIASILQSEHALIMELLESGQIPENTLNICDRYFASFAIIYAHLNRKVDFVIRCKLSFNKEVKAFVSGNEKSKIVNIKASIKGIAKLKKYGIDVSKNESIKVRLVKFILPTGEMEVLITSLLDMEKFPNHLFGELYSKRWGSETNFDVLKNKWQMGIFSGKKPQAIRQEIYATVFNCNLNSILTKNCKKEVSKVNKNRTLQYKVNLNVSIGLLRRKLINLIIFPIEKAKVILDKLLLKFVKYLEPVRPNRHFERLFLVKPPGDKYRTYSNYKRAF